MDNLDPYQILGIHQNYTLSELKDKYKKIARKVHPDRIGGNQDLFNLVSLAYKKLYEEFKLKQIDKQFNELKTDYNTYQQNNKPRRNTQMNNADYQQQQQNQQYQQQQQNQQQQYQQQPQYQQQQNQQQPQYQQQQNQQQQNQQQPQYQQQQNQQQQYQQQPQYQQQQNQQQPQYQQQQNQQQQNQQQPQYQQQQNQQQPQYQQQQNQQQPQYQQQQNQQQPQNGNFSEVFNKVYNDNKVKNPYDTGYGNFMVDSSQNRDEIDIEKKVGSMKEFNTVFDKEPINKYNKKIIRYKEPEALPSSIKTLKYTEIGVGKIGDFSTESNNLNCVDYKKAYSTSKLVDHSSIRQRTNYKDVNSIEAERSNISYNMNQKDLQKQAYLKNREELKEQKRLERIEKIDRLSERNFNNINKLMVGYKK
jgi:curved DNA-binding protein CbpA